MVPREEVHSAEVYTHRRLESLIPDKAPREKTRHLRLLGHNHDEVVRKMVPSLVQKEAPNR